MLYYGKRTKSKSEVPFRIMNQHCSSCVNNSDSSVFVLGFWRMKYCVGNVLVSGWKQVLPAFSTSYFAGLCGMVPLCLPGCQCFIFYCSALFHLKFLKIFLYFKYIAYNTLLIGQLKFIVWFCLGIAIFLL